MWLLYLLLLFLGIDVHSNPTFTTTVLISTIWRYHKDRLWKFLHLHANISTYLKLSLCSLAEPLAVLWTHGHLKIFHIEKCLYNLAFRLPFHSFKGHIATHLWAAVKRWNNMKPLTGMCIMGSWNDILFSTDWLQFLFDIYLTLCGHNTWMLQSISFNSVS